MSKHDVSDAAYGEKKPNECEDLNKKVSLRFKVP